jgi:hypothetical protein
MPILEPKKPKPNGLAIRELPDGQSPDGCEGSALFFLMDGNEMVLIVQEKRKAYVREKKAHEAERKGITLREHENGVVSDLERKAAKALEQLIPHLKRW